MPLVRVKQKYHVTLPSAIREAENIKEGDTVEVSVKALQSGTGLDPYSWVDRFLTEDGCYQCQTP